MNLTRANEQPLEYHGQADAPPGSHLDWQSDRLASNLSKIQTIFDEALAAQSKTGPVNQDEALKFRDTLAGLAHTIGLDPETRNDLTATTGRIVEALEKPEVHRALSNPRSAGEALDIVEAVVQQEFGSSTFYGISTDACNADTKLEAMCARTHALVAAGYVGEKELEGVQVAVTNSASLKARAAELFSDAIRANPYNSGFEGKSEVTQSAFFPAGALADKPTVIVAADTSTVMHPSRTTPLRDTFTHEIGHWLTRDKVGSMVAAGIDAVHKAGGPDAKHVDQFFSPKDLQGTGPSMIATNQGGLLSHDMRPLGLDVPANGVSKSWTAMVKEMQGDLMAVAGEKAQFGNAAALKLADGIVAFRQKERLFGLEDVSVAVAMPGADETKARFTEEHHTTAAVENFAAKIRNGELDKVRTPEQLDRLMGESIVRGLMTEYTQVRSAELNVHHLEGDKAVPGLPPGIDVRDFLAQELKSPLHHNPGQPTVLLTEAQAEKLPAGTSIAELNIPGKDPGQPPQHLVLAAGAPEGVNLSEIPRELISVSGHQVHSAMAPYAQQVADHRQEYLTGPARQDGYEPTAAENKRLPSSMPDAQTDAKAQEQAPQQKAEAAAQRAEARSMEMSH